ncbi:hypothetical protein FPV67DRAFT_1414070 [Lyophyllum atratum]|nr:hypothetical protein FPV67DRAFT_1414070 [Lyophyllum atratum]
MLRRAVILAVWLTSFALVWLILSAAFQVPRLPQSAMTSFCETDIISRTYLCGKPIVGRSTTTVGPERAQWADFPTLMMVQSAIAETFAGDIPVASDLALQITKAELATSDLIAAVRYSTLTTAEHLADSLTAFVRDAVVVGDSLQDLDAKAMGAIDSIIGINVWALQTIEHAKSANSGAMSSLAAWWTKKTTKEVINENFNEAMTAQSTILFHLIVLAEHSQGKLKRMKEQLQAIRDSARKENIHLTREEGELLASIWPKVGSKRRDLDRFATNLELLANLERYTDVAKLHIAQALLNLKAMQSQMKDLRSKVSQPEIAGTSIPVDVHIRTIMDGIHRMKEGRIRAREREGDIRTMGA